MAEKDAMQAGSRMHRKIQKRQGADYHAEVPMKHTVEQEDYRILVEGRADGVIEAVSGVTIDEIKCVYLDIHQLEEPLTLHLAQALCYGVYVLCGSRKYKFHYHPDHLLQSRNGGDSPPEAG
ncbi:MAG: hypothetical protein ACLUD2_06750 [Clostridium sp.]